MRALLIDGNSLGFAAQSSNKLHNSKGEQTQAVFGFIRSIRNLITDNPGYEPIVFWDGRSWRYDIFPEYKGGRDKDPKQAAEREEYRKQRPLISRFLKLLGVEQRLASNLEADDMIARATWELRSGDHVTIVSGDRDLLQLVSPQADWLNPIRLPGGKSPRLLRVTDDSFAEDTEYENADAFVMGKAMLGDTSDNLDGINGIGKKAAPLMVKSFPSIKNMIDDVRLRGDAAIPPHLSRYKKKIKDFVASEQAQRRLVRNYRLMRLTPRYVPEPETVSIMKQPFDAEAFRRECAANDFNSILTGFDKWIEPFSDAEARMAA